MPIVENSLTAAKKETSLTYSAFLNSANPKAKIIETIGLANYQKFVTDTLSATTANKDLLACDFWTLLSASLTGTALKLSFSPVLGQCYLVPFDDRKNNRKVATFILGYKGFIQLAIRSGYYKKINVLSLKEGELIRYNPMDEEIEVNLIQDEEARETLPSTGYYAMFQYQNGFTKTIYWSKKKMESHALTYSKAYASDKKNGWNNSFWTKSFDEMAWKTLLRNLISRWGIMSIDMQDAYVKDNAAMDADGNAHYVDNDGADEPAANYGATETVNAEVNDTPPPAMNTAKPAQSGINKLKGGAKNE